MYVIKRDGRRQNVFFDKITARISKLSYGLNPDFCDPVRIDSTVNPPSRRAQTIVAQKVTGGVYSGVSTTELDELAAQTAASMTSLHPDYAIVGPI